MLVCLVGLSFPVFKGILRKGYKIPTPIQRKVSGVSSLIGENHCFLMYHPFVKKFTYSGIVAFLFPPHKQFFLLMFYL